MSSQTVVDVIVSGTTTTVVDKRVDGITTVAGASPITEVTGQRPDLTVKTCLVGGEGDILSLTNDIAQVRANLIVTGTTLTDEIGVLSGHLITTGNNLEFQLSTLSGNLIASGNNLDSLRDILSGNLITTGNTLQNIITGATGDISTLTENLISTGNNLESQILNSGSITTDLSGNIITSGATLTSNLISTGNALNQERGILSGNLITTGQTLNNLFTGLNKDVEDNKNNLIDSGNNLEPRINANLVSISTLNTATGVLSSATGELQEYKFNKSGGTVSGSILPSSSGSFNLGSPSLTFQTGFFDDLEVGSNTLFIGGVPIKSINGGINFFDATGTTAFRDVSIRNLTVTGTETIIDVEHLAVKDNIIIINSGESGAGIGVRSGGLVIDRGTLPDADFLFNENTDRFEFNFPLAVDGNVVVTQNQTGAYASTSDLIQTGVTLQNQITSNDTDITSLEAATGELKTQSNATDSNLITTGQTLTSEIAIVSGIAGGSTFDALSGNLITTGQTLTSEIAIVSGMAGGSDLATLSGNLITTGQTLQTQITSNDFDISTLTSNLIVTGSRIDTVSGNLITTGQTLQTQITSNDSDITTLTSNLVQTGVRMRNFLIETGFKVDDNTQSISDINSNLISTGNNLQVQITSNDGQIAGIVGDLANTGQTLTTNINSVSSNLITTGQTLTSEIAIVSGIATGGSAQDFRELSGNLITTGQTLQVQITSNDGDIQNILTDVYNITNNLITTGQTLTSEIAIVSGLTTGSSSDPALSGKVDTLSGNLITTGQTLLNHVADVNQTLQTQITSNDSDIADLTSDLITTGQDLTSEIIIVSGIASNHTDVTALSGKVNDISGNLITTGQTLQAQITSNDAQISTISSNLSTDISNLVTTGQTLTSEIAIVSGIATGGSAEDFTALSGNLITTGQTLQSQITSNAADINTVSSNLISTGSIVDEISGNLVTTGQNLSSDISTNVVNIASNVSNISSLSTNLITTGQTLQTQITSNDLDVSDLTSNLATTGQTLQTQITSNDSDITNLTSNLITTGQTLTTDVNTVSGLITDNDADITALKSATGVLKTNTDNNTTNLITTGSVIDDVSGNLITTGQTLQTQITSNDNDISNITSNLVTTGQTLQTQITSNDSDISALTSNLITTGQTLTDEIAIVSGIATGGSEQDFRELSGNLITTGQTLQTQITSNDGDITTLTSNLVTTGQTLTTNINTVATNLGTSGQTLQTQITSNDSDISTLTSNLGTTGQTLQTQITSNDSDISTLDSTTVKLTTNQSIAGNKIFTNDVTINNLTVTGTEVIVDVENLAVRDNIIEINSGESGAGISRISGGIVIDRGTAANANILYNDANDRFELNFPLAVEGALVASASNLITTGQTLTNNINTVSTNLGTSGQTLQTQITSNDSDISTLTTNLGTTGQTLQTQITSNDSDITTLTSNLVTTGQTLTTNINTVSTNLISTGKVVDDISGNLITTGQTLQTQITSNDTDITNLSSNLVTTGQTLTTNINTVATNLVTTGQTLTSEIATVSGLIPATVIDGGGTANKVPLWSDANTIGDSVISQSSSKIGIGTATPSAPLHVAVDGTSEILLERTTNIAGMPSQIRIKSVGSEWSLANNLAGNGKFSIRDVTDSRHVMVFDGEGVVTTNKLEPLNGNDTGYLGSSSKKWKEVYFGILEADTATFSGAVTANAGLNIDNINIDGTTIALSSADLTLDVAGDIILDADGGDLIFMDGAGDRGRLIFNAANPELILKSQIPDADIKFEGNHGGVGHVTALTLDMSDAGTAIFNHDIKLADNSKAFFGNSNDLQLYHDGSNSHIKNTGSLYVASETSGDLHLRSDNDATLDVAGIINLDADGAYIYLKDAGTSVGLFKLTSSDFYIKSTVSDKDIIFQGNDGGSTVTALTLDMSDSGTAIFNHDIKLADNGKAIFGGGSDLQIYHSGADSYIVDSGAGDLYIRTSNELRLQDSTGTDNFLYALEGGDVRLYYDGAQKLATASTGVTVTGLLTSTTATFSGNITQTTGDLLYSGGINWDIKHTGASQNIVFSTTPSGGSATERIRITHDGNLSFLNDTSKIKMGLGGDLQIYHDGGNSYVSESGTGALVLQSNGTAIVLEKTDGENMILANTDGDVKLYYNGSEKLATTSTGATVTGAFKATTILDASNSAGTSGQILTSTGSALDWKTLGEISGVDGTGTAGYLSKWTDADTIGNSVIVESSSKIGIGTTTPDNLLTLRSASQYQQDLKFTVGSTAVAGGFIGAGGASENIWMSAGAELTANSQSASGFTARNNEGGGSGKAAGIRLGDSAGTITFFTASSLTNGNTFTWDGGSETGAVMSILNDGKVGIGTTSPAKTLELSNGTSNVAALRVARSTSLSDTYTELGTVGGSGRLEAFKGNIRIGADPDNNTSDSTIEFLTDNSVKMVIKSDGNVGIGTTAPSAKLHVNGAGAVHGQYLRISNGTTQTYELQPSIVGVTNNGFGIYDVTDGNYRLVIDTSGNVGIGTDMVSPTSKLHVYGNNTVSSLPNVAAQFSATGSGGLAIGDENGTDPYVGLLVSTDNFHVKTGGNNKRLTILADGKVLIGGSTALGPFGEWNWTPLLQQLGTQGIVTVRCGADVYGGAMHLASARGSNASPTIVLNGDRAGGVYYHAYDGVNFSNTPAAIECFIDGAPAADDTPGRLVFSTAPDGSNSITERMRITSAGKVGIGTATPGEILTLDSTSNTRLLMREGGSNKGQISAGGGGLYIQNLAGDVIFRNISDADTVRIKNDGKVGIGTSSPAVLLDIYESSSGSAWIKLGNSSRPAGMYIGMDAGELQQIYVGGNNPLAFWTNDTERVRITGGGKVGIGTTAPLALLHLKGGTATNEASHILFENTQGAKKFAVGGGGSGVTNNGLGFRNVTDNTLPMIISDSGKVGIGTTAPLARLHVREASAGSFTYDGTADTLIVESNANGGITIATAAANTGRIIFASPNDPTGAEIKYSDTTSLMTIGTTTPNDHLVLQAGNGVEAVRVQSDGNVGIGTTAPSADLEVSTTSGGELLVTRSGNSGVTLQQVNGGATTSGSLAIKAGTSISFSTNGTNQGLFINNQTYPRVGIGTSSFRSIGGLNPQLLNIEGVNSQWDSGLAIVSNAAGQYEAACLVLGRTGGTTAGSNTIVADNNVIGRLIFTAADGVDMRVTPAEIRSSVDDSSPAADSIKGNLEFYTNDGSSVAPAVRFSIAPAGAVTFNSAFTFPTADGSAGQVLQTNGSGTVTWASVTGGGGVSGSGTDNYIPRWNGTTALENSIIQDNGTTVTVGGALKVVDATVSYSSGQNRLEVDKDLKLERTTGTSIYMRRTTADTVSLLGKIEFGNNNIDSNVAVISAYQGGATDAGELRFETEATGGSLTTRLTINSVGTSTFSGYVGISGLDLGVGWGDLNTGIFGRGTANSSSYLQFRVNGGTAAIHIDSNKKVGIGTTAPSVHLDVYNSSGWGVVDIDGTSGGELRFQKTGTTWLDIYANDSSYAVLKAASHLSVYVNNSTLAAYFQNDGKVGIGTNAPSSLLTLQSPDAGAADIFAIKADDGGNLYRVGKDANDHGYIELFDGASTPIKVRLNSSGSSYFNGGNFGIGTTAPATKLTIESDSTGESISDGLRLQNSHGVNNDISPIYFGVHGGTRRAKCGIGWKRTGSYGIGKLLFALDNNGDDADVSFANDTKITFQGDGKVGIGTTAPDKLLHISSGDGTSVMRFSDTRTAMTTGDIGLIEFETFDTGSPGVGGYILGEAGGTGGQVDLAFAAGLGGSATEVMRIVSEGSVGIGTAAPGAKLNVVGGAIRVDNTASTPVRLQLNNSGTNDYASIYADTATAYKNLILNQAGGNVGIGTVTPGQKLHVEGSDDPNLLVTRAGVNKVLLGDTGSNNGGDLILYNADGVLKTIIRSGASSYFNGGNVGIGSASPAAPLDVPRASDYKVIKLGDDITSHYVMTGNSDHTLTLTCGSYYQAEIIVTAHQTNGGTYNNLYIRGIWSNNDTSHHWDEIETVGSLTNSTFTITNGQNGATAASGEWKIVHDYVSGTFVKFTVRITDFYGTHAYTIS